jgi:DNA-binding LacI/PurR family transcriptional regulator
VRITLKEVAQKARVSPSTVSRALAGRAGVAEETQRRILQIVEELGYRPNELARGLVRASSNIIGGLILEFANPFFVPLIEAIEAVADEHDYVAVIAETRRQMSVEMRLVERLHRLRVAGYVITPVLQSTKHLLAMSDEGIPVVVVGRRCDELDYVCLDDASGAALVGQHLIRLGHQRVAYVYSGEAFNEPEETRWRGFQKALQEAGIECDENCRIKVGNNRMDGGQRGADRVLDLPSRPTAVFGATDRLAMGLIHRFRQRGVQVPDDIAVVGYDDIPSARYFEVALTTISYPKYEMGRLAAQMLFERIQNKGVKRIVHVRLQPDLVVRESCGAPQDERRKEVEPKRVANGMCMDT